MTALAPSLYIHVPFCRHRCGYCNFTLVANRDHWIDRYLAALQAEMERFDRFAECKEVATVFLGGGTPSHLSADQLRQLFDSIHHRFSVTEDAEVSIECNPSDLDEDKVGLFRSLGINRISLGVQSFNSEKLQLLERDHRFEQIGRAFQLASGVTSNVSLDLIFGVPDESINAWLDDLNCAFALQPKHLSTYELTIEKGTQFWNRSNKGTLQRPAEDLLADMYERTIQAASARGYEQYEISSFAVPGFASKHNLTYWNGQPYLAFGPGAARFFNSTREQNHRSTIGYLKLIEAGQSAVVEKELLDQRSLALDRIVFGLRQIAGFSRLNFAVDFKVDAKVLLGDLGELLTDQGFLRWDDTTCRLTNRGVLMYDSIADQIVAAAAQWEL